MKRLIFAVRLVKNTPTILLVNGAKKENDDVAFEIII